MSHCWSFQLANRLFIDSFYRKVIHEKSWIYFEYFFCDISLWNTRSSINQNENGLENSLRVFNFTSTGISMELKLNFYVTFIVMFKFTFFSNFIYIFNSRLMMCVPTSQLEIDNGLCVFIMRMNVKINSQLYVRSQHFNSIWYLID